MAQGNRYMLVTMDYFILGGWKTRPTPLHPQSDGLVECFNWTLTTQLTILVDQQQRDWDLHLSMVLDVCFEFVVEPKTWSQANNSCETHGGELLNLMDNLTKTFLNNVTREENTGNFTWWIGEGVRGKGQNTTTGHDDVSEDFCTYMKLNPLQLGTANCNHRRGFLCTHSFQAPSNTKNKLNSSHASRPRPKRTVDPVLVASITKLLKTSDEKLRYIEMTEGEPTNAMRDEFYSTLMNGAKNLTSEFVLNHDEDITHFFSASNAILHLLQKKCDIETNPNPHSVIEDFVEIIYTVAKLMTDHKTRIINTVTTTAYISRSSSEDIGNVVLGSENGTSVKFPSFSAMKNQFGQASETVSQVTVFRENPHPTDENITGEVCSVKLSDGVNDIALTNLQEKIEIFLSRQVGEFTSDTVDLMTGMKSVTILNVSDPNTTIVFYVEPSVNVSLLLTLSHDSPPNSTYFTCKTVLIPQDGNQWVITPDMRQRSSARTWYLDTRYNDSSLDLNIKLKISTSTMKCMYWNKLHESWLTDGIDVGPKATPWRTQCLCSHLTIFGSSFFVMPNQIDLSRTEELFATVKDNYVVVALLSAFFGLYLITLAWAIYADRRARSKRKMTLLEDNHPGAQYNYLVGVQTGHRKGAGTSANVTIKLTGSNGESAIHRLTDSDKPVFERGAFDVFVLSTPFSLGEVESVRLQHDNSGSHPSWYISKVTVQDLQTHYVFHYFCNCWMSSDRGDGMTKKTFNAAKNNEVTSFRNIFRSRTSTGFRDEHIWVSIVDPPSRSPFTRAQRVSCCMSLLLCTMAINIAFWNLPEDKNSAVIFSIGTLKITWQEFMVGVQCGLLMFPINILIITIFRSIRPRLIAKSKKDDPEENLPPPALNVATILKDTADIITQLNQCPRNKMDSVLSEVNELQSSTDLCPALDRMHSFIQHMQGESDSDPHWVYCSRFLLTGLCHLLMCLEKVDEKTFSSPAEYQQVISLTTLLIRKVEMVFSSHFTNCPPPVQPKKKTMSCWLPWWCVFVGWFLLLSISAVSTYFTLVYGFAYGKEKSIKWVMSLGLSLFESIFILQPLKVIGVAVLFALLLKPVAVEDNEEVEQVLSEQHERCRRYAGRDIL
ncbi:polycystin-1-like protein 2 [Pholidichthys leucotaenia]